MLRANDASERGDLLELEEFHRLQLADARIRYEQSEPKRTREPTGDALDRFADLVMRGQHGQYSFPISFRKQLE
jgi:hypothetical protein